MKEKFNDLLNRVKNWFKTVPVSWYNKTIEWFKKTPERWAKFVAYCKEIPAKLKNFGLKVKNYNYKNLPHDTLVLLSSDGAIKLYSSLACIVVSLLLGLIILIAINPSIALTEFGNLISGGMTFGSTNFYAIIANTAPLLCCGLSIVFANKTGMFNIGVAGQYTIGIFGSLMFALQFNWPWYACILMAMIFGAIWGGIPGFLKAHFNVNEVLSGIMLNWIALFFTNYSFQTYLSGCVDIQQGSKTYTLASANPSALIPNLGLSQQTGGYFTISIFIAIIAALIVLFILKKTTLGFQLKASGLNKDATRYAGIKDKRNIVVSLAISGALAGLGASLYYLAGLEQYSVQASSALPALPWNGIVVAFLGQLSPIGTIFATLFTSLISQGSRAMLQTSFPAEIADIITGVVVYFSGLTSLLVILANKYLFKKKRQNAELLLEKANASQDVVLETGNSETITSDKIVDSQEVADSTESEEK